MVSAGSPRRGGHRERQRSKREQHHRCRERVQAESFPERGSAETHGEEHQENGHAGQNDVEGVAQRASAGCQRVTKVHRGKRPEEAKGSIGHQDQAADDAQRANTTGRFQTPHRRRSRARCRRHRAASTVTRRRADRGELTDRLRMRSCSRTTGARRTPIITAYNNDERIPQTSNVLRTVAPHRRLAGVKGNDLCEGQSHTAPARAIGEQVACQSPMRVFVSIPAID